MNRMSKPLRHSASRLGPRPRALITAVANAFFPPGGPLSLSGCDAGVVGYIDRYVSRTEPLQRTMIRLLIAFIQLGPLAFGPRRVPFTRLTQAERIRSLDEMFASSIYFRRVAFTSIRALMTMAYLANEDVATAMGMVAHLDPFDLGDEATPLGASGTRAKVAVPASSGGRASDQEVS
jgi:hypothetical protein